MNSYANRSAFDDCGCNLLNFYSRGEGPQSQNTCRNDIQQRVYSNRSSQKTPSFSPTRKLSISKIKRKANLNKRTSDAIRQSDSEKKVTEDTSIGVLSNQGISLQLGSNKKKGVDVGQPNILLDRFKTKFAVLNKKYSVQNPQVVSGCLPLRKVESLRTRPNVFPKQILINIPQQRVDIIHPSPLTPTKKAQEYCEQRFRPEYQHSYFKPKSSFQKAQLQPRIEYLQMYRTPQIQVTMASSDDIRTPKNSISLNQRLNRESLASRKFKQSLFRAVLSQNDTLSVYEDQQSVVIKRFLLQRHINPRVSEDCNLMRSSNQLSHLSQISNPSVMTSRVCEEYNTREISRI